jgi:hypothetical protein
MEHWTPAIVIDERTCLELFGDGTATELLVEFPGGERTWVSSWDEIKNVPLCQDREAAPSESVTNKKNETVNG